MEEWKELARKAAHSDEAFIKLYRIFYPRVYGFVFAKVKNGSAADDVTSEVFLKALLHLESYRGESSFSTWITAIAMQEVSRFFYRQGRMREITWEEFFDLADLPENRPEEILLQEESRRELLKALDDLSERERLLVELKHFAGLTQKEIAGQLDMPQSNVGVMLHRAMEKIRKKWGTELENPDAQRQPER